MNPNHIVTVLSSDEKTLSVFTKSYHIHLEDWMSVFDAVLYRRLDGAKTNQLSVRRFLKKHHNRLENCRDVLRVEPSAISANFDPHKGDFMYIQKILNSNNDRNVVGFSHKIKFFKECA